MSVQLHVAPHNIRKTTEQGTLGTLIQAQVLILIMGQNQVPLAFTQSPFCIGSVPNTQYKTLSLSNECVSSGTVSILHLYVLQTHAAETAHQDSGAPSRAVSSERHERQGEHQDEARA